MTAVALVPVQIDRSGTVATPTPTQAVGATGVSAPQAPGMFFRVKWTATDTGLVVTIPGGGPDGTTVTKTIPLAGSSGDVMVGPWPQAIYGSTVTMISSAVTTLAVAIQLTPAFN
jgi:hypothetical protein